MNWLKWHVGTFTDPKFAVIAKKAGQPKHAVLAVWAALLETACNGVKRGDVSSFNPEEIGIALDLEPEAVMAIFTAIMARGMVTEDRQLSAWEKRQTQDYSTDRVRKFREKQRGENQSTTNNETDETRSIVTETPRNECNAEEKRGEKKRIDSESVADASRDLESVIFDQGSQWLAKKIKREEPAARRIVAKWIKDHGRDAVLAALGNAQRAGAYEPVSYIEAILRQKPRAPPPKTRITPIGVGG